MSFSPHSQPNLYKDCTRKQRQIGVCVASVMHSGTHLVFNMLRESMGCKGISLQDIREGKPGVALFHLVDAHKGELRLSCPIITPMRHPVRILESFRRRGKPQSEMESQFRNLDKLDPLFIHVDHIARDQHVKRVGDRLGIDLKTDWPLLSPKGTVGFKVTPERVSAIPGWIMDIYTHSLET